jgi:inner membrane protein
MDSLSQLALGAAVSVAVMRRRTAVWKAAAWGAVAGTLPDLDVLVDHGDPILNMVLHRAESHALFWLALLSLPLAAAIAALHRERPHWRAWWLAIALALLTHPLLDLMTVYGTQLLLPFTNRPYGVGSVFIIDPLYTLPLLVGTVWALVSRGSTAGLRANVAGLVLSTAYLGWGAAAQQHVARRAAQSLAQQGVAVQRLLVTPTPFNSVLWRVVAVGQGPAASAAAGSPGPGGAAGPAPVFFYEGFHSLLDAPGPITFDRFDRGDGLAVHLQGHDGTQRIRDFSQGFFKLHVQGDSLRVSDLRMGQEPNYVFSFAVARRRVESGAWQAMPTQAAGGRGDPRQALAWLWQRLQGHPLPPPR